MSVSFFLTNCAYRIGSRRYAEEKKRQTITSTKAETTPGRRLETIIFRIAQNFVYEFIWIMYVRGATR